MEKLIPVLSCLGMNSAISLDDDHSQQFVHKSSGILIDNLLKNGEALFSEDDESIIYDSGVVTIHDAMQNDTLPETLKAKLFEASKPKNTDSPLEALEALFDNTTISFKKITKLEEINNGTTNNGIWFLDKEIDGANILGIAATTIMDRTQNGEDSIIVVFTKDNSLEDINSSWERRYRYLHEELEINDDRAKELAYSFFVVSKTEFLEKRKHGIKAAIQYLSDMIINSLCGFCIKKTISLMKEMQNKSIVEIEVAARGITKDNSELYIFNNMISEGEHNLYYHLKALHDLRLQYEYINCHEKLWKYVACMKMIANISGDECERIISTFKTIIDQFDWTHLQFINTAVNKEYADISYGDVFNLKLISPDGTTEDYIGVLITQACDCILRNNGVFSRKAKNLSLLLFKAHNFTLELDSLKTNPQRIIKLRNLRNKAILIKQDSEGNCLFIDAEKSEFEIKIAPFILDLTSLDKDGRAIVLSESELEERIIKTKISNWKEYIGYINENSNIVVNQISEFKNLDFADKAIGKIYGIEFSCSEKEFSIQRIGCMDRKLTDYIVSHFTSDEYRIGKPSLIALSEESLLIKNDY